MYYIHVNQVLMTACVLVLKITINQIDLKIIQNTPIKKGWLRRLFKYIDKFSVFLYIKDVFDLNLNVDILFKKN
jgi:hypothetical protein